jgi:hypothetical protein
MPKDPFIREKFTRERLGRQKGGRGIFRTIPEGPISDRGRKLAQSAVGKYRIHHEAPARPDRGWSLKSDKGWRRRFEDPIPLPRGRQLVTLKDAADHIMKLPKAEQKLEEWQTATSCLIGAAEGRDFLMHARIGILRALNRRVERVFNPDRKDAHWGKRKLARDR